MLKRILESASMHLIACSGVHFQRITSLPSAHLVKQKPKTEKDDSEILADMISYIPSTAYILHKRFSCQFKQINLPAITLLINAI